MKTKIDLLPIDGIKVIWGYDYTGNSNDNGIVVIGTRNEELALNMAQEFFSKELPHLTAFRWYAYSDDSADLVYVSISDVG